MTAPACDDWQCPARVSCARFYGRSHDYAAMKPPAGGWMQRQRDPEKDSCKAWELDKPKAWLMRPAWPVAGVVFIAADAWHMPERKS